MRIAIYIDFKSPHAYLAMRPTLALLAEHPRLEAAWLPFDTRQKPVPQAKAVENRSESHFRVRAEARQATHLYYADVLGVPMSFPQDPGETTLALAALCDCQTDPLPFINAAFHAYWVNHADLNDEGTVRGLLADCGLDADGFSPRDALTKLEQTIASAGELGVIDTPAYLVADQLFIGREHLPWIRELLSA